MTNKPTAQTTNITHQLSVASYLKRRLHPNTNDPSRITKLQPTPMTKPRPTDGPPSSASALPSMAWPAAADPALTRLPAWQVSRVT